MAKRPKVVQRLVEIESASPSAAIVEKILLSLRPDREITAGEFLKRAFQFPQIEKIVVQKYSVGTWNFAEDLGNLGPTQDTSNIEAYLKEKYGAWRFRLLAVVQGEAVCHCMVNLDGWQENEGRAAAAAQSNRASGPTLGAGAKAVGPGATSELLTMARERIEIENTQRLLSSLATGTNAPAPTQIDVMTAPVKAMMEMMTVMMSSMKEMFTVSRGGMPTQQEDRFLAYLQGEIHFLREQMKQPQAARDPDALTKTITTIDNLLQSALGTSLAEVLTKTPVNEATGWSATIQGIIEGVKPYLGEIMGAIRTAVPSGPRALGPANVIPINRNRVDPNATSTPEGNEADMKANPEIVELLNLLIDSLKKKEYDTVDAILTNPPMRGQFNLNPNTPGTVYAVMLKVVDPRFGAMAADIQGYLEHIKEEIAKAEAEETATDE